MGIDCNLSSVPQLAAATAKGEHQLFIHYGDIGEHAAALAGLS
jgi:hypothetical protein